MAETEWLTKYRAFNDVLQRRLALQEKENNERAMTDAQLAKLLRHRLERLETELKSVLVGVAPRTRWAIIDELNNLAAVIEDIEERLTK